MAFKLVRGRVKTEWLPVTTSTALSKDSLVEMTSNLIAAADDNDTDLWGVLEKAITSADSDYATARLVPITVPVERHVVWEADTSDTAAASHIGVEYGIVSATEVDLDDTTNDVFRVISVPSASKVQGYLKISGSY